MKTKFLTILALLTIASQGAWADDVLTLYNNSDNNSAIEQAKGQTSDVTLQGRTIYKDGDWNTLCLPFDMTAEQIAASPLAGFTIMSLTSTEWQNNYNKLYLTFNDATTIEAGKPYIVKWPVITINNAFDWDQMVTNISSGVSYKDKIVKLTTDITVPTDQMVGNSTANAFDGIFDGNGHTITCDIHYTNYEGGAAPFHAIRDATIMNLKVAGSVEGYDHSAGLVGFAAGTNIITNCEVAATITAKAVIGKTDTYCGGILGNSISSSTTTISNCLFSGSISSTATVHVGAIFGWGENKSQQNIDHCLANVTDANGNSYDMILGDGTITVEKCYKNIDSGNYGTKLSSITSDVCTDEYLGSANWEWDSSESKAHPKMNITCDLTNPVFKGVTIKNTSPAGAGIQYDNNRNDEYHVRFTGTYDPISFNAVDQSILFLGTQNTLYYPESGASIGACRAYFKIGQDGASSAPRITSFDFNFGDGEATSITVPSFQGSTGSGDSWYDLSGRRLHTVPTQRGIYINNGKKIMVK